MGPVQQQTRTASRSTTGAAAAGAPSADQEDTFRCQIHQEIERKAKVCANTLYECSLPRVESYAYCFRHILQDPKAPYKQCGFAYANGRRCLEPSPRYDAKKDYGSNYCFEHSRQTQLTKTKSTIGKLVPVETTETLLHGLAHHVKVDKNKQHYMGNNTPLKITVHEDDDDNDVDVVTPSVDPFVDVDITAINDSGRIVLDYASDSSTEDEEPPQPTYGSSWKGQDMDNSDNESVDSQCDDPLKHAGIYTAEETTRITKEKLSRLQSLYVEQIHRLHHVLRERRRSYLREQRAERETHCSIYDQINETPRERALYEKLKGLNRYHRKHGVEAILQRKYLEKRAKATEGLQQKPPPLPKCSYTEGGVKCGERTLPCCKHCRKHILEDKKQVLFRACGIEKSGVVCQEPLAGLFENVTCQLHVELPAQRSFNKRKYESESEGEAELVAADGTPLVAAATGAGDSVTEDAVANIANVSASQGSHPDDRKDVKDGVKTESKPGTVKAEGKRRSVKQEVPTPTRARNTRAGRAALERQQQQQKKDTVPSNVDEEMVEVKATIKQEIEQKPEGDAPQQQQQQQPTSPVHSMVKDEGNVTTVQGTDVHELCSILDEDQLPVSIIARKKPKLENAPAGNNKPADGTVATDGTVEKKDTAPLDPEQSGKESQVKSTLTPPVPHIVPPNEGEKQMDDTEKLADVAENSASALPAKEKSDEHATQEKVDGGEAKPSYSLPEPSNKRRRTIAEQKRDKLKDSSLPKTSASKEEAIQADEAAAGSTMAVDSKTPTPVTNTASSATSDEEKGSKASKQPKSKSDHPSEAVTGLPGKGGEKSRRQPK